MEESRLAHAYVFDCTCGKRFQGPPKQVTALRKAHVKRCKSKGASTEPMHSGRVTVDKPKMLSKGRAEFKEHVNKVMSNPVAHRTIILEDNN